MTAPRRPPPTAPTWARPAAFVCLCIATVLVPRASPAFSALGTLVADPTVDEERSIIAPVAEMPIAKMRELWSELSRRASSCLGEAGFASGEIEATWQINMRYPGQNFSLSFDVAQGGVDELGWLDESLGQRALRLFNERHVEEYGHIREDELPEVTGVRLVARVPTPSPMSAKPEMPGERKAPIASTRLANLGNGHLETNIIDGSAMAPGDYVIGPAIIAEVFTTIVVYPGWRADVDGAGDYVMRRLAADQA